jgi:hypothetical protein
MDLSNIRQSTLQIIDALVAETSQPEFVEASKAFDDVYDSLQSPTAPSESGEGGLQFSPPYLNTVEVSLGIIWFTRVVVNAIFQEWGEEWLRAAEKLAVKKNIVSSRNAERIRRVAARMLNVTARKA